MSAHRFSPLFLRSHRGNNALLCKINAFTNFESNLLGGFTNQLTKNLNSTSALPRSNFHTSCQVSRGQGENQNDQNPVGKVSLVQGASRGIGLEFVRQLLSSHPNNHVIATCRNPASAPELAELAEENKGRLSILPLDLTDEKTIQDATSTVHKMYGRINLLINASGILHIPNEMTPETSISRVDMNALMLCYSINAMGPLLVVKHMLPLLSEGGKSSLDQTCSVIASLSARVGSISDNSIGGWYSYRASKSALNQLMKTASIEIARKRVPVATILLHPGTVNTDLSRPFQKNVPPEKLFTKQFSAESLLKIIRDVRMSHNGKFFAWDGSEIPW